VTAAEKKAVKTLAAPLLKRIGDKMAGSKSQFIRKLVAWFR
jgi:hypothetical protein